MPRALPAKCEKGPVVAEIVAALGAGACAEAGYETPTGQTVTAYIDAILKDSKSLTKSGVRPYSRARDVRPLAYALTVLNMPPARTLHRTRADRRRRRSCERQCRCGKPYAAGAARREARRAHPGGRAREEGVGQAGSRARKSWQECAGRSTRKLDARRRQRQPGGSVRERGEAWARLAIRGGGLR